MCIVQPGLPQWLIHAGQTTRSVPHVALDAIPLRGEAGFIEVLW